MLLHEALRHRVTDAGLRAVLQFSVATILLTAGAHAENAPKAAVPGGELHAKIAYCENCHGVSAQGFHGYYPIPRLAGQQPDYIKNQLHAFIEHRRTNNIMFNIAHSLNPAMIDALAADFRELNPAPLGGGARRLMSTGETIIQNGVPEANVAACAACHGPEAQGTGEIPRLAGQLPDYLFNKLVNWSKERGQNPTEPDISAVMSPVAHSLTRPQVEAVAAYLSYLK